MPYQEHLRLQEFWLRPGEQWTIEQNPQPPGYSFSFIFPRKGKGTYVAGPVCRFLNPGDLLVIRPRSDFTVCRPEDREFGFHHFSVLPEHLLPVLTGPELRLSRSKDHQYGELYYPAESALATKCHRLTRSVSEEHDLDHRCQLLHIAGAVLSAVFKEESLARRRVNRTDQAIREVLQRLSIAEVTALSLDELARRFNCGRRHLNRLFQRHFGMSVSSLRMEMRLVRAIYLLRDQETKIINIAEECGFNHLGLFNACFKRRFGVTPSQFRKLLAPEPGATSGMEEAGFECWLKAHQLCPKVRCGSIQEEGGE
jgi:AraC-like DNA-binding protein